ncbi:MAG: hypothetical protein II823_04805 [Kiritimatiellae bacterium]|nr:hypothetical protein [Kiritimatiellia bacterium]
MKNTEEGCILQKQQAELKGKVSDLESRQAEKATTNIVTVVVKPDTPTVVVTAGAATEDL